MPHAIFTFLFFALLFTDGKGKEVALLLVGAMWAVYAFATRTRTARAVAPAPPSAPINAVHQIERLVTAAPMLWCCLGLFLATVIYLHFGKEWSWTWSIVSGILITLLLLWAYHTGLRGLLHGLGYILSRLWSLICLPVRTLGWVGVVISIAIIVIIISSIVIMVR